MFYFGGLVRGLQSPVQQHAPKPDQCAPMAPSQCMYGGGASGTNYGVLEKNHLPRGSTAPPPPLDGSIPAPPQRRCTALGAAREEGDSLSAGVKLRAPRKIGEG